MATTSIKNQTKNKNTYVAEEQTDIGKNNRQQSFDQHFESVMTDFGKTCDKHKINLAFAIAIHPNESQPLIFSKGHEYDVAALIAAVLKMMKQKFDHELGVDINKH